VHHEMDCFLTTTSEHLAHTTIELSQPPESQWEMGVAIVFHFEEGEISGMIISRRPNKYASSENAPAPRIASATATMTESIVPNLVKSELETLENAVDAKAMLANAAVILANGVKKPIISDAPITKASALISQTTNVEAPVAAR
jgi:hypothetical protein